MGGARAAGERAGLGWREGGWDGVWEMSWGGGAKRGELRGAGLRRAWAFQAGGACEVGDGYTGSTDSWVGREFGQGRARALAYDQRCDGR